jgi:hypothetical protein
MQFCKLPLVIGTAAVIAAMSGCASMSETTTTSYAYEIYNVEAVPQDRVAIENAMINGIKVRLNKINVQKNLPPHPLPDEPGRFQTQQLGAGTGMAAMAAMAGSGLPVVVSCPGAAVVANTSDGDFSGYGETTRYTFCLWQYKDGYNIDAFVSYTSKSGFVGDPNVLGAQLARAVVGDSSKLIPLVMKDIREKLESTGKKVTVVDRYSPFPDQG